MKYKEFNEWCNQRACDGCWGLQEAIICIDIIKKMQSVSFFKRKSKWIELEPVANEIVTKTNKIIKEVMNNGN